MTNQEKLKKYNEFIQKMRDKVPSEASLLEAVSTAFNAIYEAWGLPDVNLAEKSEEMINGNPEVRAKFDSCVDDCTAALANALSENPTVEKVSTGDGYIGLGKYRVALYPAVGNMLNYVTNNPTFNKQDEVESYFEEDTVLSDGFPVAVFLYDLAGKTVYADLMRPEDAGDVAYGVARHIPTPYTKSNFVTSAAKRTAMRSMASQHA